jgi:hypothetical protein
MTKSTTLTARVDAALDAELNLTGDGDGAHEVVAHQ